MLEGSFNERCLEVPRERQVESTLYRTFGHSILDWRSNIQISSTIISLCMYNVFHVSMFPKYLTDSTHTIDYKLL